MTDELPEQAAEPEPAEQAHDGSGSETEGGSPSQTPPLPSGGGEGRQPNWIASVWRRLLGRSQ
jgi:hypothetical protein